MSSSLSVLAPVLAGYCNSKGKIALSGILQEQESAIKEIYSQWFDFQPSYYKEGWVLIFGIKRWLSKLQHKKIFYEYII